jgi:hypothetical protein
MTPTAFAVYNCIDGKDIDTYGIIDYGDTTTR